MSDILATLIKNDPHKAAHIINTWEKTIAGIAAQLYKQKRYGELRELLLVEATNKEDLIKSRWASFAAAHQHEFGILSPELVDGAILKEEWEHIPSESTHEQTESSHNEEHKKKEEHPSAHHPHKSSLMEEDPRYKQIEEGLKQKWLDKKATWVQTWKQQHPDIDEQQMPQVLHQALEDSSEFSSHAYLDFLYGSLDDPQKETLTSEARRRFKETYKTSPDLALYEKNESILTDERAVHIQRKTAMHIAARQNAAYQHILQSQPDLAYEKFFNESLEEFNQQRARIINSQRIQAQSFYPAIPAENFNPVFQEYEEPYQPLQRVPQTQQQEGISQQRHSSSNINLNPQSYVKKFQNLQKFLRNPVEYLKNMARPFTNGLGNVAGAGSGAGGGAAGAGGAAGTAGVAGGGAAAGAAGAGGAGAGGGLLATIGLPVALFLVVIIIFVVIIILLFSAYNPPVYIQTACSSNLPGNIDAKGIGLLLNNEFGLSIEVNGTAATELPKNPDQKILITTERIYNDICRLYGHQLGGKAIVTTPTPGFLAQDNTFGNLFRGYHNHEYDSTKAGGQHTNSIRLWFSPGPFDQKQPCTVDLNTNLKLPSPTDMELDIYQPDKCGAPLDLNTNDYHLEFLMDRNLAKELIPRAEEQLKNEKINDPYYTNFTVFEDFKSQIYKNGTSLLPNPDCQKTTGSNRAIECFADMVGDYMTWGGYHNFEISPSPQGGNTHNALADFAFNFVAQLKNNRNCDHVPPGQYLGGFAKLNKGDIDRVTHGNSPCAPNLPNNARHDFLEYSVHTFGILECVNFVQAMAAATGKPFNTKGNAIDFAGKSKPPTYNFIKNDGKPLVGDVAIWRKGGAHLNPSGEPGHIAIIIYVSPDNKMIKVAEGNGFGQGEVDTSFYPVDRTTGINDLYLVGWLRPK